MTEKRPHPILTPGAFDLVSPLPIRRHVTLSVKLHVLRLYRVGLIRWALFYRIDHLIPLEIGGTNDVRNLWPEPIRQSKAKDKDENAAARQLRTGLDRGAVIRDFLAKWGPRQD